MAGQQHPGLHPSALASLGQLEGLSQESLMVWSLHLRLLQPARVSEYVLTLFLMLA